MSEWKEETNGKQPSKLIEDFTNHKPLVMFFGLTNSPATFQTMMDAIFEELISEGVIVVRATAEPNLIGF